MVSCWERLYLLVTCHESDPFACIWKTRDQHLKIQSFSSIHSKMVRSLPSAAISKSFTWGIGLCLGGSVAFYIWTRWVGSVYDKNKKKTNDVETGMNMLFREWCHGWAQDIYPSIYFTHKKKYTHANLYKRRSTHTHPHIHTQTYTHVKTRTQIHKRRYKQAVNCIIEVSILY